MSDSEWELPESLVAHARRFAAEGGEPAVPRPAATVMLLRDRPGGVEVYTIRRAGTMAFAAAMHAFPGGTVDPRDAGRDLRWAGPAPAAWAARLGLDDDTAARAVVCAAVRETFEETGVLLAGPDLDSVVGDVSGAEWETARQALVTREYGFADFLTDRALVLRSDLLAAWGRWVTPECEPRRYDTYFFVAAMPEAQRTREVGGEADQVAWVRPGDAVARHSAGAMPMLPPTVVTLRSLAGYVDSAAVVAAAGGRDLSPVLPRIDVDAAGSGRLALPEEPATGHA